MLEVWKDIKNFENYYQISNLGNVKSLSRRIIFKDGRSRVWPEIVLKPRLDGKKYYFVTLHKDGEEFQLRVHRLVAEHFIDNINTKPCINHKDGNRLNNIIDNLEWCTHKENTKDGILRGSINKPGKKINDLDVLKIRTLYKTNQYYQKDLGKLFGISQTQISRILREKNWK